MKPLTLLAALLCAAGCALQQHLRLGLIEAEVLRELGPPSGRHELGEGRRRLEYASGPYGRETWMVDFDAQGRVSGWHNALEESRLHALQQRLARPEALLRAELLRTLGRPGERVTGGWLGAGELWSWRFVTNDCLLFQATLDADGRVRDAGFNIDPRCDANDRASS